MRETHPLWLQIALRYGCDLWYLAERIVERLLQICCNIVKLY